MTKYKTKKAKLIFAENEGGDDQLAVDIIKDGKKYSGYVPRAGK